MTASRPVPGLFVPELGLDPARGATPAAAGVLVAAAVRFLGATVRLQHHGRSPVGRAAGGGGLIVAFWHRHLAMIPWCRHGERVAGLISQHRDGDLAAVAADRLGLDSVRGSSTRGGLAALRGLLRKAREGYDLAITPDGPKGPPGVAKPGTALLAAATGWPIVPVGIAASPCRRLRSWDRMILPLPGARVAMVYGELLPAPGWDGVEPATEELTRSLDAAEAAAERALAARGSEPAANSSPGETGDGGTEDGGTEDLGTGDGGTGDGGTDERTAT